MQLTFRVRSVVLALLVLLSAALASQAQLQAERQAPHGYLGVFLAPAEDGETGVLVRNVSPDSPAAKAGLKVGDRVVKVNDKDIRDVETFRSNIADHKPGDKFKLGIVRDGKEQTLTATLRERPARETAEFPQFPGRGRPAFLGIQAQPVTPELKERLKIQADRGAVVMEIVPKSPAEKAGLKRDDVITAVDDQQIHEPDDLFNSIQKAGKGKTVTLHVMRGKESLSLKATPRDGSFGHFLTPGEERFPTVDVQSMFDQARRIRELEHRVAELEKQIRQLEKK
jgi:S1-C subfamily serine protease